MSVNKTNSKLQSIAGCYRLSNGLSSLRGGGGDPIVETRTPTWDKDKKQKEEEQR